ncbi:MAG: polysaccharide biosynthesis permease, partial [Cytophagales bacterium]|nr:polysaccharide biosynthesis permease [Cytophagales bacterium]
MLTYAWPLLFMGLAGVTNEMLSRALLRHWLPTNFYPGMSQLAALGVFGACYKLSVFMTLTVQAFRYAAEPFFFSQAADKQSPLLFARVMDGFVLVTTLIYLLISLNLDWIGAVFLRSPIYWQGLEVVPILLLANLFLGIYFNLSVWFKLTDSTQYGMWLALLGAAATVMGNALLVPYLGYIGSAWATLACYALMSAACYALGQRRFPIPYRPVRYLLQLAAASAIIYFFMQWQPKDPARGWLLKNSIWFLFAL